MKYTYNRIGLLPEGGRTGIKGHKWVVKNRSYEVMAREVEKRYFEILKEVA